MSRTTNPWLRKCIQELDELIMSLDRYPPTAVAVAMGTYLEGLLGDSSMRDQCTADDVRELLREIEAGVLEEHPPAKR